MIKALEKHSGKIFLAIVLLLLFSMGFYPYLQLHPIGPHFIRQTDSFAFVDYYQNNGYNFFEPGGWYLGDSGGKTASEFPILYYLVAILGQFTDNEHVLLRLITLSISFLGFYHLFKLLQLVLKNSLQAGIFTLLFFSSTVILYYSVNFLPDASALGLTLSGWYFGIKGYYSKDQKSLLFAFPFFLFAGLLKITFLIHPIALLSALLVSSIQSGRLKESFKNQYRSLTALTGILIVVFLWYAYAKEYNKANNSNVFLTDITPIWKMSSLQISQTWGAIHHSWFSSYYYQTTFHVFFVLILLGFFKGSFKKLDFLSWTVIFSCIGCLFFMVLFFLQFKDHDYYMLNCAPFVFFLVVHSFRNLKKGFPYIFNQPIITLGLAVLTSLSLFYASGKLKERFTMVSPRFEKNVAALKGIESFLNEKNVHPKAKFVVVTDETFNGPFYYLKRHGWTFSKSELRKGITNHRYLSKADYLLITSDVKGAFWAESEYKLAGEYQGLKLYSKVIY